MVKLVSSSKLASPKRKRGRPLKLQVVVTDNPAGIMPLDYMLAVVRDPTATQERRDRMSIAAAPYCHPRATEAPLGKKERQAEAVVTAGAGTEWADDLKFENRAN